MKPNRLVVILVTTVFLIGGGVWLGISLMQKNSQPIVAIQITQNLQNKQNNGIFLLLNAKNKIIFANFDKTIDKNNFDGQKIIGESMAQFCDNFFEFQKQNLSQEGYTIKIFSEKHDTAIKTKKTIKKSFSNCFGNDQNIKEPSFLLHTQIKYISQVYKNFE